MLKSSPDILGLLGARRLWVLVVLLWAFAYLPFLGTRDLRQEEGRRAGPARNMLASGDFVTPRLFGEPYLSKPPGYFWITAAVGWLQGGVNELSPRIPAVLAVLIGSLLMFRFAPMDLSRATRGLAALLLPTAAVLLDKGTLGEIDSLLSMLVFACLLTFYNAYRRAYAGVTPADGAGGIMLRAWVIIGALGAAMVLIKGHPGPIQVMLPIFFFLMWEKRLRILLAPGPVICFVIAVLPFAAWVWALQSRNHFDLVGIWARQSGADAGEGGAGMFFQRYWRHLLDYSGDVLVMPLPWLIWALPCLFIKPRRFAGGGEGGVSSPALQRFLICCVLAIFIPFFLWPTALGRHVLAIVYPLALLAAIFIVRDVSRTVPDRMRRMSFTAANLLAYFPALAAIAAIVLAVIYVKVAVWVTLALAIVGLFFTAILVSVLRQSERSRSQAGVALIVTLALTIFAGRYAASCLYIPIKSTTDDTRLLRVELQKLLAGRNDVYTMEYFRPQTNGLFYNVQFYAGQNLKALKSPADVPAAGEILVIGTEADRDAMIKAGVKVEVVGDTSATTAMKKAGPLVMYLFRASR